MITVRFPTGLSVQYNEANMVTPLGDGYHDIVRKEPYRWYARVAGDCLIEGVHPRRTYNAMSPLPNSELDAIRREIASLKRAINKKGKP